MYLLLVYLFAIIGFSFIFMDENLPNWYMAIVLFFTFKWIFNYRKCTISYIECVIRKVKKEEGYLYRFLNGIVDIRYHNHIALFYLMSFFIITYHYFYKGNKLHNY